MPGVSSQLPGHNCGACGFPRCDEFSLALTTGKAQVSDCRVLEQERYRENRESIEKALAASRASPARRAEAVAKESENPVGLIDGYEADFVLAPADGEASCREILMQISPAEVGPGDVIRYRPLGCPITHFAKIISKRDGLLVVHIVGPRHRLGDEEFTFTDVGVCMVIGFEGSVRGRQPSVGETVRFKPAECMMQKVHSGVIVRSEGSMVLIEGIDLKVWAPPIRGREA